MRILLIALVSVIIGLFLYFNFSGKLNKKNLAILGILFAVCGILAFIYTQIIDSENRLDAEIIAAFERGESIKCGEILVDSEHFTFTNGTLSFTGKRGTAHANRIISIEDCE